MFNKQFKMDKNKIPVIHHITNHVTSNDQANIVLAVGGSPVMAESVNEVQEITNISDCLVLNFGTLNDERFDAMKASAKIANSKNIPIIIDPIGIGVSTYRRNCLNQILNYYKVSIIKCNEPELLALADIESKSIGIDSLVNERDLSKISKMVSERYNLCLLKTGKTDIISYKDKYSRICGGSELLKKITGTGCMLTSVTAVFSVQLDYFTACELSSYYFKKAAEKASNNISNKYELGSFKVEFFNEIAKMFNQIYTKWDVYDNE